MESDRKDGFWGLFIGYVLVLLGCLVTIVLTYRAKEIGSLIGEFMWPFDPESARWATIVMAALVGAVALAWSLMMLWKRFSRRG